MPKKQKGDMKQKAEQKAFFSVEASRNLSNYFNY